MAYLLVDAYYSLLINTYYVNTITAIQATKIIGKWIIFWVDRLKKKITVTCIFLQSWQTIGKKSQTNF